MDGNSTTILLRFVPCLGDADICAPKREINTFLDGVTLTLFAKTNYINMNEVLS